MGLEREARNEGGGPNRVHSGNNLLNLLLHLPAIATHPEPHPVAHCEKATQDSDGRELEFKRQRRGLGE